jgi:aminoglycoside 6'-N-acetyltransferase I
MTAVRLLGPGDAAVFDRVVEGVFDNPIDPRWRADFFADPRHHLAVAIDGDLVVGMASAVHYVYPDKPPELWVNEVGVAPAYRSRGIGRALLEALFQRERSWAAPRRGWGPSRRTPRHDGCTSPPAARRSRW